MKECYANTNNHYILNLEKGTAIDSGLRGSAARFVNHSCSPNSEMQKWNVNGLPRIGLFAIDNIPAGTELTYDYNFDWFEGAQMQICLCGEPNCRGFIGKKTLNQKSTTPTSTKSSECSSPVSIKGRKKATYTSKLVSIKGLKAKTYFSKKTRSSSPTQSIIEPVLKIEEDTAPVIPETEDEFEDVHDEPTDVTMTENTDNVSKSTADNSFVSEPDSNLEKIKASRRRGRPKGSKTQKPELLEYYSSTTRLTRSSLSQPMTRSKRNLALAKNQKVTESNSNMTRKTFLTRKSVSSPGKETSDNDDYADVIAISVTPEPSSTPASFDAAPVFEASGQSDIEEHSVLDIGSTDLNEEQSSGSELIDNMITRSTRMTKETFERTEISNRLNTNTFLLKNQQTKHSKFNCSASPVSKATDCSNDSSISEIKALELSKQTESVLEVPETDISTSNSPVPISRSTRKQHTESEHPFSPVLSNISSLSSLKSSSVETKTNFSIKRSKSVSVSKISRPRRKRKQTVPFEAENTLSTADSVIKNIPSSQKVLTGLNKPAQNAPELVNSSSDPSGLHSSVSKDSGFVSVVENSTVGTDTRNTATTSTASVYTTGPQNSISKTPHVIESQSTGMASSLGHKNTTVSPTSSSPYRSIINSSDQQSHSAMNISQASQNQQQQYYYPSLPLQSHSSQHQQQPHQQNQQSQQPQQLPKITTESFQSAPNMIHPPTAPYISSYSSSQRVPSYSGYYGSNHQYALVPLHPPTSSYPPAAYPPPHTGHVISLGHGMQHVPPPNISTPLPSISSSEQMVPPPPNFSIPPSQSSSSQQQQQSSQQFPLPPQPRQHSQHLPQQQQQPYQQQQYAQPQHFQQSQHLSQNPLHPPQLTSNKYDSYDQRRLSLPGNSESDVTRNLDIHHNTLSSVSTGHPSILPPRPRSYSVYQSSTSNEGHAVTEPPRNLITDPQNYRIQNHGSTGSDSNWRQQVSIQSLVSSPPSDSRSLQPQKETRTSPQRTNSISSIVNPHNEYFSNHNVASKPSLPKVGPISAISANKNSALVKNPNPVTPAAAPSNTAKEVPLKSGSVSVHPRTKLTKLTKVKQLTKPKRGRPPNSTRLNLASPQPIAPLAVASTSGVGSSILSLKADSVSIQPKTGLTSSSSTIASGDKVKRKTRPANPKSSTTVPPANKPRRGRPPNSGPAQRNFLAPLALRPQVFPVDYKTDSFRHGKFPGIAIRTNVLGGNPISSSRGLRLQPTKPMDQSMLGKRLRVGEDNSILTKRIKGFSSVIPSTHAVVVAPVTVSTSNPQGSKGRSIDSSTRSGRTESPKLTVSNAIKAAIGSNSRVTPVAVTPVKSIDLAGSSGLVTMIVRNNDEGNFSTPRSGTVSTKRGRGRPRIRPKDYWTYNNRKARGEFGPGGSINNSLTANISSSGISSETVGLDESSLTSPRGLMVHEKLAKTQPRTGSSSGSEFLAVNSHNVAATATTGSSQRK